MFLSALADLGVDFSPLLASLREAGVDARLEQRRISRAAGPGLHTAISLPDAQPLRHLPEITAIVDRLNMPEELRVKAVSMFRRLAEAEAEAHGCSLTEVHFHEVGAVDTLVDVLGALFGLRLLQVEELVFGPIPWFSGFVDCAHGRLALPAPATAVLLRGKPVFESGAEEELITPTGALLLDTLAQRYAGTGSTSAGQTLLYERCGLGYGSREPVPGSDWAGRGLRLHLFAGQGGQEDSLPGCLRDEVQEISCRLDHLTGEELGRAIEVISAQTLDTLWLPGITKKNRPGGELRVLCRPQDLKATLELVFKHTHTLGLRLSRLCRLTLPRRETLLDSPWGTLRAKEYSLDGQSYLRPEHESLADKSEELGLGLPALRVVKKD